MSRDSEAAAHATRASRFRLRLTWIGRTLATVAVTLLGLAALCVLAFIKSAGSSAFGGMFVLDDLAIFAKRLFLVSAFLSVLAGLALPAAPLTRRSTEYHVVLLASLLGMLVLGSARDIIVLFVAFELMSIPLYVLTGFQKRDARAPEPRGSGAASTNLTSLA